MRQFKARVTIETVVELPDEGQTIEEIRTGFLSKVNQTLEETGTCEDVCQDMVAALEDGEEIANSVEISIDEIEPLSPEAAVLNY